MATLGNWGRMTSQAGWKTWFCSNCRHSCTPNMQRHSAHSKHATDMCNTVLKKPFFKSMHAKFMMCTSLCLIAGLLFFWSTRFYSLPSWWINDITDVPQGTKQTTTMLLYSTVCSTITGNNQFSFNSQTCPHLRTNLQNYKDQSCKIRQILRWN